MKPFEYFESGTVEEATQLLAEYGRRAEVLAGGIDLVPRMRKGQIQPEYVVSIQKIHGLDCIERDGEKGLRIGALTSLRTVELSPLIRNDYVVLHEALRSIASIQVKTMGTVVGNICVGTPASDVIVALFALGARLKIVSISQERMISIENFFVGVKQNVLQPGEIVTEVLLPIPAVGTRGGFLKMARTATDIAKVNVAVVLRIADDRCEHAKIAVGSVAPTVIRAKGAEEILKGKKPGKEIIKEAAEVAAKEGNPITDIRSTGEYRKEIIKVLVRRAVERVI